MHTSCLMSDAKSRPPLSADSTGVQITHVRDQTHSRQSDQQTPQNRRLPYSLHAIATFWHLIWIRCQPASFLAGESVDTACHLSFAIPAKTKPVPCLVFSCPSRRSGTSPLLPREYCGLQRQLRILFHKTLGLGAQLSTTTVPRLPFHDYVPRLPFPTQVTDKILRRSSTICRIYLNRLALITVSRRCVSKGGPSALQKKDTTA